MKKIFILFLLIINSCGYQPLYKSNNEMNNNKISDIKFFWNKKIGTEIFNKLPFVLIKSDEFLNRVVLDTKKNTAATSKNSKGQITSYRTAIAIQLKILDKDGNIIKEKFTEKEFSYNAGENKFKLKEYQNEIETNLINSIVDDIIFYLNYSW